jgi:hypothetical protein
MGGQLTPRKSALDSTPADSELLGSLFQGQKLVCHIGRHAKLFYRAEEDAIALEHGHCATEVTARRNVRKGSDLRLQVYADIESSSARLSKLPPSTPATVRASGVQRNVRVDP